jgi:hypothetical protein
VNRQSKRLDLGDKIIETVVVDLILGLDVALQSDPMQRHAPRAQVTHERQQRLPPRRELFADALDVVIVDHQLGRRIGLVSQAKCGVSMYLTPRCCSQIEGRNPATAPLASSIGSLTTCQVFILPRYRDTTRSMCIESSRSASACRSLLSNSASRHTRPAYGRAWSSRWRRRMPAPCR